MPFCNGMIYTKNFSLSMLAIFVVEISTFLITQDLTSINACIDK